METIFSTTTMASSITSPIAAASPPSVIRLKLSPIAQSKRTVKAMVTGITSPATSDDVQSLQEEEQDDARKDQTDQNGVAYAPDALAHQIRLVVVRFETTPGRQGSS